MLCKYCRSPLKEELACHCRWCAGHHERAWDDLIDPRSIYRETRMDQLRERFPYLDEQYSQILAWNHRSDRGLVVFGDAGTGKTRTCWVLLRRLFDDGVDVAALSAPALGAGISRHSYEGDVDRWIAHLADHEVLFIDDIDKATLTPRVQEGLYVVLETMTQMSRKLVITTNAKGKDFQLKFDPTIGPALKRRVGEFCRPIEMYRKKP